MERAKARGDLKKFKVTCLSDSDTKNAPVCNSWFVASGGEPDFQSIGSVYFNDSGRVRLVMKYYDNRTWERDPAKLGGVYVRGAEAVRQGARFTTTIGEVRQPGWTNKAIDFHNGRKMIRFASGAGGVRPDGSTIRPFVSIHENLE
jgi:hypothetical protein